MKHLIAVLGMCFLTTTAHGQDQSGCRQEPISVLLAKMETKKFISVVKFDIAIAETQTLPATMIANPATGAWFILVETGTNQTCIPIGGYKLEPVR
jgi:hypothetical protein